MLSGHPVYATIPTQDVASLRRFYEDVLGLPGPARDPVDASTTTPAAGRSSRSRGAAASRPASHTQMAFRVEDIQGEVTALRANGVAFEEYETPKTVDGIADVGAGWAAWLKDPDGNLIGIWQFKPDA